MNASADVAIERNREGYQYLSIELSCCRCGKQSGNIEKSNSRDALLIPNGWAVNTDEDGRLQAICYNCIDQMVGLALVKGSL